MSRSANRSPKGPSSCSLPLPRQTPADRNIDCVQPVSVSALLVGLILAASLSGLLVSPGLIERSLLRPYWLVRKHQYATIITSAFMHANLAHLAFNLITFWSFGFQLERAMGTGRFAALSLCGLLSAAGGAWLKYRADPG